MHPIDPPFAINLLFCCVFFAAGTALGFVVSRFRSSALQATALVGGGLVVGGFLRYTFVMSQVFSIENRIGPTSSSSPGPDAATKRDSNSKTSR